MKWACQISESIRYLHSLGCSWGDVKSGNVLIDGCGDAWIVDFAGSCTDGWVDMDLKETTAGDLQGLGRIIKFLQTEE